MIENITQGEYGFKATIDGIEMFIPDDMGNRHRRMIQEAIDDGAEVNIDPVSLTSIPNLTFAQLLIGLVTEEWISESEGEEWLKGNLPTTVEAVIAQLPANQRFIARARASRPTEVVRNDTLVNALAQFSGKTQEQLDTFFITYSQA